MNSNVVENVGYKIDMTSSQPTKIKHFIIYTQKEKKNGNIIYKSGQMIKTNICSFDSVSKFINVTI